ncbi:uncharacterized protein LOC108740605 [Agrilus planipennis]|uniref:Uncharacterized protein LOC108740605 n=1 Tax=Agrilus planipennis TaxID=224129 RepID=A0A1W4XDH1_AGRPL|nr:uncharacterized protein LOC108740605 [Agrilus planipennis]
MSAEYFTIEEIRDPSKYYEGYCVSKKTRTPEERYFGVDEIEEITTTSKKSQERLHEIEEQLVQAEDKCNKLKNQLDFMKRIYQQGDFRNKVPQSQSFDEAEKSITDSVNRLSELHSHIHEVEPEPVPLVYRRDASVEANIQNSATHGTQKSVKRGTRSDASEDTSIERIHDIHKKRPSVVSIKSKKFKKVYKNKLIKPKESSTSVISSNIQVLGSTVMNNDNKKNITKSGTSQTKTRSKPPPTQAKTVDSRKSTRPTRRIIRSKTTMSSKTQILNSSSKSQNLVELFHNSAVKESDSEGSTTCIKQTRTCQTVPPLDIEVNQTQSYNNDGQEDCKDDGNNYVEPATPRVHSNESCIVKRYELPTIASKMKQVDKNYWRSFDVRSIPFCPAKSTSPSHNIGLNIQQVMSIMKTRQPLSGISPTLAHNIGLAAGKLNNSPLSTLMTTLSSRIGCGKAQCPMMKDTINYHKLCELAKELPDEIMGDTFMDAGQGDARNTGNAMYMAASEGSHYPETCWTIDSSRNSRCTCLPQKTAEFNSSLPLQKFHSTATYESIDSSNQRHYYPASQQPAWSYDSSRMRQIMTAQGYTVAPSMQCQYVQQQQQQQQNASDANVPSSLQGKEKSLKAVLQNLHDEFEIMNREYEDFADKIDKNEVENIEEAREQLDNMEKGLNNKEEEIQIVMALYKEVLALKEQVRKLKQRSTATVVSYYPPKIPGVKDQNAIIHLTKLLKQIQSYQRYYYLRKSL